ncbi:MAG: DJ-1 family glyoxalase III [Anaerovoracaceae bacterium]
MVLIHLATGFEEVEALTAADLLRRAEIDCRLVSVTGERVVAGTHGISVEADCLFEEADYDACEMIVLPGGMPGAQGLRDHAGLGREIVRFAEEGKPLAAICAAPLVLGHYDVLQGRKSTIYPGMEEFLTGGVHVDKPVVRDGNLITGQGPAFAMEFALELVTFLKGEKTAKNMRRDLLLER